jgi:hypothetical protein
MGYTPLPSMTQNYQTIEPSFTRLIFVVDRYPLKDNTTYTNADISVYRGGFEPMSQRSTHHINYINLKNGKVMGEGVSAECTLET